MQVQRYCAVQYRAGRYCPSCGRNYEPVASSQFLGKVNTVERKRRSIELRISVAKMRHTARDRASSARNWARGATLFGFHSAGALLLVLALLAMFPNAARANVAVTKTLNFVANNGATTSGAFDTTGANLVLIGVSLQKLASITGITYNTTTVQNFTQVASCTNGVTNTAAMDIWRLGPPFTTSSTATITITTSGVAASSVIVGAVAFSGVSSLGTCVTATNTSNSASVTVTSPGTGGVVFDTLAAAKTLTSATAGGSQVPEWNFNSSSQVYGAGSVSIPTTMMSWSLNSSVLWALGAVPIIPTSTTAVRVSSLTATQYAAGNLIELKTGHEVSSLGFNLYREQSGQRVKLNSSLLAGSALLAGPATAFTAGHSHAWLDNAASAGGASYWVEEVDTSGQRTMYGPVNPQAPSIAETAVGVSPLVAPSGPRGMAQARMISGVGAETVSANDLPSAALRPPQPPTNQITRNDQAMQYQLAARPAIKLGIDSEGWYRVSQPDLVAAGLDPNTHARTLQLYAEGVEQPIVVHAQPNGRLNTQGSIEFYATGLDTTWSSTQTYWLVWGEGSGRRVGSAASKSQAPAGPASFPFSIQWKPRTVYFAALLNGDADNFFGPVLSGVDEGSSAQPVTDALAVTHLDASANAQLQVTLQGVSAGSHAVTVQINGYQAGGVHFSDQGSGLATLVVPRGVLQEGTNNLSLTVAGGAEDISVVDTVVLTYSHTSMADGDYLRLSAPAGRLEKIGGFSNPQIQVMDVTDPANVLAVPGTVSLQLNGTNRTYAISVLPPGSGTRTLLAFTGAQASRPASITANHPSSWHAAKSGADMVIISHANFLPALGPLQALRQGQGHTVVAIDVADLYDEFNFGAKSPYAIKTFLATASSTWTKKPKWVLLAGDATFDPRNFLGVGDFDFVPTYLADTALLETASEDWFADFSNTGLAQMAIGRLPVRTADEAAAVVNKIVGYAQSDSSAWKNQALLVSGANDDSNPFEAYTSAVQNLVPTSVIVSKVLAGSDSNPNADLISSLDKGQALVNYIGHGSDEVWAGGLFDSAQASGLLNGPQTPFVISMTCLNGYFQDVYTVALAKALINVPGGGAVAVWASSGLTDSGSQSALDQAMIRALYGSSSLTLGEAAIAAKKAVSDLDVRRTWILFGDPAMKLH